MKKNTPFTGLQYVRACLVLAFLLGTGKGFAQVFIDSACSQYFRITAKLRQGDSLGREEWKAFVADKHIADYMADQGLGADYLEAYRQNMQIVYMPQYDSLLQQRLTQPEQYWLTYIIYQYKKEEEGMKAYLKKLEADPAAYFDTCYQYAYSALPKAAQTKLPALQVAIIPVHNDAHAQKGLVIYTLLCAYYNDRNRLGALGGHELHHMLRPKPTFDIAKGDEGVVIALYRVLNEGSADMVDKKYMTDTARILLPSQRYYQEFFNEGKKILPLMDSLLSTDPAGWASLKAGSFFKGTDYSSGHVPGTYMSHYIEKNGLKAELLQHLDDPFYFFLVYDRAAKKDKEKPFRFSAKSITHLQQLRTKYFPASKS